MNETQIKNIAICVTSFLVLVCVYVFIVHPWLAKKQTTSVSKPIPTTVPISPLVNQPTALPIPPPGATSGSCNVSAAPNLLVTGSKLITGTTLTSPSGRYILGLQPDGVLELRCGQNVVWKVGKSGSSGKAYLIIQTDGNLVLYMDQGVSQAPLWASGTFTSDIQRLRVEDSGNIILETAACLQKWASGTSNISCDGSCNVSVAPNLLVTGSKLVTGTTLTSPSGRYILGLQPDGVLELRCGQNVVWKVGKSGSSGKAYLIIQTDGNLVLYMDQGVSQVPLWASGTFTSDVQRLRVDDNGNIILETATCLRQWASGTSNVPCGP